MTFQEQHCERAASQLQQHDGSVATANAAHANAYTYIFASSLRSGMRSIARRIESGPTRGREGPEASEGGREREETYERERDKGKREGDTRRMVERDRKKGKRKKKIEGERKTEREIIRERERTEGEET